MLSLSPSLIETIESEAVDSLRRLNAGLLGHFRRDHLWYFATILPGFFSFIGFFALVITFHADGNFNETGKAPFFLLILLYAVLPFAAHFYLSFYDVLLPNFLLMFQMIQLSAAVSLCAMGYVDRQWFALTPCLIFMLLPNLLGWSYGIFCFQRCRQRTVLPSQRGVRSFWKMPRVQVENAETDDSTPDLLALEYLSRYRSTLGASSSPRTTDSEETESQWSTPSSVDQSAASESSPIVTLRLQHEANERPQSESTPRTGAPSNQRQSSSSIDGLEFEPNQTFSERYMPICLSYGSAILLTGALETVATLSYTSISQSPTDKRLERSTFVLGLTLPMFDTILLISFVLWTVSRKYIAIRAYVFEVLQFCLTALWVTLTVLFELQPLSDDMPGFLFIPILITLQMADSALHAIFLIHFAFHLHFKDSDLGERVML